MPTRAFIPFDAFALAAVASELRHTVLPSRVQKIYQPTSSELVITLFGAGGAHTLYVSANGQSARVHLTQIRRENPTNPPAFCQVCRKYLDGTFLEGVEMPRFDRVLHLIFRGVDGERFRLIAELMGRNSNLILMSGGGLVRGSIRSAPTSSTRSLRPGTPYTDPPGYGDKRDPLTVKADDAVWVDAPRTGTVREVATWLSGIFSGITPFATLEIKNRATDLNYAPPVLPNAFVGLMDEVKAERFAPYHIGQSSENGRGVYTRGVWPFVPYSAPPALRFARPGGISLALDTFYQTQADWQKRDSEAAQLRKILTREIAYREKEAASMEATLREGHRAELHEQTANNLLAQLHLVQKGQASATIADLYDTTGQSKEITVALDPKKSPQENAQAYFTRAKKARDAQSYAQSRADGLRPEIVELQRIAQSLADETDEITLAQIERLRSETAAIVGEPRMTATSGETQTSASGDKNEKPWAGHKIRAYTLDGYELLIGETAEANDFLTTRVAQPNDWWFHVRGGPGAHGVLRTNNQPTRVPDSVLRRAAQAVAARSGTSVKHAGTVAVDMIEKRHVRKPRGAKPGLVTYSTGRERVLDVTPALP